MTVGLVLGDGSHSALLTPDQVGTNIPVYVYATITGSSAPTLQANGTVQLSTGQFEGLQYLYYNINNAPTDVGGGAGEQDGKIVSATLNSALGFNANGSQVGAISSSEATQQSTGISVGGTSLTSYAKPRAASVVYQNATTTVGGTTYVHPTGQANTPGNSILVQGNSVSFLVETLEYQYNSYNAATVPGSEVSTTLSVSVPSISAPYNGSNYTQNITSKPSGGLGAGNTYTSVVPNTYVSGGTPGAPASILQPSVTFTDALQGDVNLDGQVDGDDLTLLGFNYGTSGNNWTGGNVDGNPSGDVAGDQLTLLGFNYGTAYSSSILGDFTPGEAAFASGDYGNPLAIVASPTAEIAGGASVPEPTTLSLLAIGGVALLSRRSRRRA
jgi:hypothetical protein